MIAIFEVGRTGPLSEEFGEDVDGVVEAEVAGHATGPQARSVGQQPPPRLEGQDRKPGEQEGAMWEIEEGRAVDDVSGEVEGAAAEEGEVGDDDGGSFSDDMGVIEVMGITRDGVCV